MSSSEEPNPACKDTNEDIGSSRTQKGKFKRLSDVDPDDCISLAQLVPSRKKNLKQRTTQKVVINPEFTLKQTPTPMTPLKTNTGTLSSFAYRLLFKLLHNTTFILLFT